MIKATGVMDGRPTLFVGLSFGNLDRFRDQPGDTFVRIDGTEIGLPIDVLIFSGRTEAELVDLLKAGIGRGPRKPSH